MKNLITSVLAVSVLIAPASAAALPTVQPSNLSNLVSLKVTEPKLAGGISVQKPIEQKPAEKPAAPLPVVYTVVSGDSLSKIGKAHETEWQRIWSKNTQLQHPDRISIGEQLTIPAANETVAPRELPAAPQPAPAAVSTGGLGAGPSQPAPAPVAAPAAPAAYDWSNTYGSGQCTWYAKHRRGNTIPNSLGNANTWYSRAQALGMATGLEPRAGAIGTTERGSHGHVVYVESVNSDGSIVISEMNYDYNGSTRTITTHASQYRYIY